MNDAIVIATRGSALALAQAHAIHDQCRRAFPRLQFEIKIIKTTGDKLQTSSVSAKDGSLPKGLFTKELEVALVKGRADLAVHSLKDLPTELPPGLKLGAVGKRADVRDVLIYRDAEYLRAVEAQAALTEWVPGQSQRRGYARGLTLKNLPAGAIVATGSPRRQLQILEQRPDLKVAPIRGNVVTRLQKLAERAENDAIVLAMAGMERLDFKVTPAGDLKGDAVPDGLFAAVLPCEIMLPCVGQAAIGIEVRAGDERIATICERLNHYNTHQCVLAERALLRAMGGGCQAPIGALAEVVGTTLRLRAIVFRDNKSFRAELTAPLAQAESLGEALAAKMLG